MAFITKDLDGYIIDFVPVENGVTTIDESHINEPLASLVDTQDMLNSVKDGYETIASDYLSHKGNTSNPHQVTATDVGLGSTADVTFNSVTASIITNSIAHTTGPLNIGVDGSPEVINIGTGTGTTTINVGTSIDTVSIAGNLVVTGTTTTANTVELNVTDKAIRTNKGGNNALSEGAGLIVEGDSGSTRASFLLNSTGNWVASSGLEIGTNSIKMGSYTLTVPATGTAALLGTAQTFTALNTFNEGLAIAVNKAIAFGSSTSITQTSSRGNIHISGPYTIAGVSDMTDRVVSYGNNLYWDGTNLTKTNTNIGGAALLMSAPNGLTGGFEFLGLTDTDNATVTTVSLMTLKNTGIVNKVATTFSGGFAAQTISGAVTWSGAQTVQGLFTAGTAAAGQDHLIYTKDSNGAPGTGLVISSAGSRSIILGNDVTNSYSHLRSTTEMRFFAASTEVMKYTASAITLSQRTSLTTANITGAYASGNLIANSLGMWMSSAKSRFASIGPDNSTYGTFEFIPSTLDGTGVPVVTIASNAITLSQPVTVTQGGLAGNVTFQTSGIATVSMTNSHNVLRFGLGGFGGMLGSYKQGSSGTALTYNAYHDTINTDSWTKTNTGTSAVMMSAGDGATRGFEVWVNAAATNSGNFATFWGSSPVIQATSTAITLSQPVTIAGVLLTTKGAGTTNGTSAQIWQNSSGTSVAALDCVGGLSLGASAGIANFTASAITFSQTPTIVSTYGGTLKIKRTNVSSGSTGVISFYNEVDQIAASITCSSTTGQTPTGGLQFNIRNGATSPNYGIVDSTGKWELGPVGSGLQLALEVNGGIQFGSATGSDAYLSSRTTTLANAATYTIGPRASTQGVYIVANVTDGIQAIVALPGSASISYTPVILADPGALISTTDGGTKFALYVDGTYYVLKNKYGTTKTYRLIALGNSLL